MSIATHTESGRIKSLHKYNILDTPPDGSFDRITKLAALLLDVPIAIVTMVDTDRIWFKSKHGLDAQQIGRDPGLCASAILSDDLYEVGDTLTDPRTLSNPLVASDFGLRFYAAVPLKVSDGHNLGTLCVLDRKPRRLSRDQKNTLQYLADITIDQLELRLAARQAVYQQNQLLNLAMHDLKIPLTVVIAWADLAKSVSDNPDEIVLYCDRIIEAGSKINRKVNELLEAAGNEAGQINLRLSPISITDVVTRVVETNTILARNKDIRLHFTAHQQPSILGDEDKLTEIAENLINNAIKFSPLGKNVYVDIYEEEKWAYIKIKDEGPGLTDADKAQLYERFVRRSAKPTAGEISTGLGLSIVKTLVEAHDGEVSAYSDGKSTGTSFIVKFPVHS